MSYSLSRKCGTCKKKVACIDSSFIMGAINAMYQANYTDANRQVHLGSGIIVLDCFKYQDEKEIQDLAEKDSIHGEDTPKI